MCGTDRLFQFTELTHRRTHSLPEDKVDLASIFILCGPRSARSFRIYFSHRWPFYHFPVAPLPLPISRQLGQMVPSLPSKNKGVCCTVVHFPGTLGWIKTASFTPPVTSIFAGEKKLRMVKVAGIKLQSLSV